MEILKGLKDEVHNKLTVREISHAIVSAIEMDNRGFINELNVWATNPFINYNFIETSLSLL